MQQQADISSSQQSNDNPLANLSTGKIMLPILIGLLVVAYMLYTGVDMDVLRQTKWGWRTAVFLVLALILMAFRHFAYMFRIKKLLNDKLNWRQSFEVISLLEFGSAVTPSTVGGTAVIFFLMTKEKIKTGKAATVVLTTMFLDGMYFVACVPIMWLLIGNEFFSPELATGAIQSLSEASYIVYTFFVGYFVMTLNCAAIAYGLFVSPTSFKWLLEKITALPILNRWREGASRLGDEMIMASEGLKKEKLSYWTNGISSTFLAWTLRFLVVNCILVSISLNPGWFDHFLIWGRQLIMYVLMVLAPTPGGSGVAEGSFAAFLSDFVPDGLTAVLALIWRIITYYPYLALGVIVLPIWIKRVFSKDTATN